MTQEDSNRISNTYNVLWLLIGVFLFPAIRSIESLIIGFLKLLGVSNVSAVICAIIFYGLVSLGLLYILIWVVKNWTTEKGRSFLALSLKSIKKLGLIVLLMAVVGRVMSFFNLETVSGELDLMDADRIIDMQYSMNILFIINSIISLFRDLLLFLIFIVIIFKTGNRMRHNHQS